MNDVNRFRRLMERVCIVYGRDLTATLQDAWWEACANLSDDQFEAGVRVALKEATRFPTPAVVRAAAFAAKEERDTRQGGDGGNPSIPRLEPGPMVDQNRAEGRKYAAAHLVASGHVTPLYDCLRCLDRHFVRVDVMVGTPHFGASIPCPHCRGDRYEAYTQKHGVPPGMPKWSA